MFVCLSVCHLSLNIVCVFVCLSVCHLPPNIVCVFVCLSVCINTYSQVDPIKQEYVLISLRFIGEEKHVVILKQKL